MDGYILYISTWGWGLAHSHTVKTYGCARQSHTSERSPKIRPHKCSLRHVPVVGFTGKFTSHFCSEKLQTQLIYLFNT